MFCEKCGAQVEEDALFCPECGNRFEAGSGGNSEEGAVKSVIYCPNCGTECEEDAVFCSSCGASFKEDVDGTGRGAVSKGSGKKGGTLFAGAAAVILIAVGVIVFFVWKPAGNGGGETPLVYLKDNEFVCYTKKLKSVLNGDVYEEKDDISGPAGDMEGTVQFSADGKYMFYPNDYNRTEECFDLYYKPVNDEKAAGEKLASSVEEYSVLQNGKIVYLESGKLYLADFANKEKVASDVAWYQVSEDEKQIFWMSSDDDARAYVCDAALENDKIKLASDVSEVVYLSDDFTVIIYQSDEGMYCLKNFEDREKITSDEVLGWQLAESGEDTVFYYRVREDEEILLSDLMEDDLSAKKTEATEMQTYLRENYLSIEAVLFDEAATVYSYSPENGEKQECASGVIEFFNAENLPVFSYLYYDIDQVEKTKLSTMEAWAMDCDTEDEFGEKFAGELLRSLYETAELRLISNGTEIVLDYDAEEYGRCFGFGVTEDTKEYYIVAIPVDNLINYDMGEAAIEEVSYDDIYEESGLYGEEEIFADREEASAKEDVEFNLAVFKTNYGEMDGKLELVSEDITDEWLTDKGIYYITDVNNGKGELYYNGSRVDSDVMPDSVVELKNKDGVLYLTDPSDKNAEGTLKIYINGETKKIADDVAAGSYSSDEKQNVVFLANYNFTKYRGDLKQYSNGEVMSIDNDVTAVINF